MKGWTDEYLKERKTELAGVFNEKLEEALRATFQKFDLTRAKKKRSSNSVFPLFVPSFEEIAEHPNASTTWVPEMAGMANEVVGDFNLPSDAAGKARFTTLAKAAFAAMASPDRPRGRAHSSPAVDRSAGMAEQRLQRELDAWSVSNQLPSIADVAGLPWASVEPLLSGLSLGAQVKIRELAGVDKGDPRGRAPKTGDRGASKRDKPDMLDLLARRLGSFDRSRHRSPSRSPSRSSSRSPSFSPSRPRRASTSSRPRDTLIQNFSRMMGMSDSAVPLLTKAGEGLREMPDWPLTGRHAERYAPDFLAQVFAHHRRAEDWAKEWARAKFQTSTPHGLTMLRYGLILDHGLLYDSTHQEFNMLNSVMVEIVVRDMYGLVVAFEDVSVPEDLKEQGKKRNKIVWGKRDLHDLAAANKEAVSLPRADKLVGQHAKRKRVQSKWLTGSLTP